jgi:hypothetical protein
LTAFIVESKDLLQEDPQDVMVDILISITNSMANGTYTPYVKPSYEVPAYAIIVNVLFFASISTSIFAALAAVVALQWVGQYDSALDSGDPEKLALVRQYRFMGVQKWKMHEIIRAIPLLLYISVFLFFTGLIEWMWTLHRVVGGIILAGACAALAFYVITTIIAVVDSGSPYRSVLSDWVARTRTWAIRAYIGIRDTPPYKRYTYLLPSLFRSAGEKEVHFAGSDEVRREAVIWAAKRVNRSPMFHNRLLHIVKYASQLKIPSSKRHETRFKSAPWANIFDSILETIMTNSLHTNTSPVQQMHTIMGYLSHSKWGAEEYISYRYGDIKALFGDNPTDEEISLFIRLYKWSEDPDNDFFFEMLQEFLGRKEGITHSSKIISYAMNRFTATYWLQFEPIFSMNIIKILDQQLSIISTSVVDAIFPKIFTCGTRPPRIEHLTTLSSTPDELVMDIAIKSIPHNSMEISQSYTYVAPELTLEVRVRGVTIALQVEDFIFEGKARVKLRLMDRLPYVQFIDISLLEEPLIDFTLHSLGFTNVPGLKGFLSDSIHSTLRPMMYDPNVLTVDIEHLVTGLPRPRPPITAVGALKVTAVSASITDPKKRDKGGLNPYVSLSLNEGKEGLPVRTSWKADTQTPIWNESKFLIPNSISNTLTLTILSHRERGKDKELGTVYWDMSNVQSNTSDNIKGTIMLDGREIGELTFQVLLFPVILPTATDQGDADPSKVHAGIVRIKVYQAKELDSSRSTHSDLLHSHLDIYNGNDLIGSTGVIKYTLNPVWQYTTEFVCLEQDACMITFKVIDDTSSPNDPLVGFCKIPLKHLLKRSQVEGNLHDAESLEGKVGRESEVDVGGEGNQYVGQTMDDNGDDTGIDGDNDEGVWYPLSGCTSGKIKFSIDWAPLDMSQSQQQPPILNSDKQHDSSKAERAYDLVG